MFGNIVIDKMELKFKEYYSYKSYYCGLCKSLKKKYGNTSRLTLNYDITFLILLLSSLYEPTNRVSNENCLVHPRKKQVIFQNEITDYAAAINVMLSYYNLIDNWDDEKDVKSIVVARLLQKDFEIASKEYPQKAEAIKNNLKKISELEKQNTSEIEDVSNLFGYLMEEIILYRNDIWERNLRKIGFFLGKYIYLLDAYEDREKDLKNKSYNPFNVLNSSEDEIIELLILNLSFLSNEIEKLPLIQDKGIIDNIIYSGMKSKINKEENTE